MFSKNVTFSILTGTPCGSVLTDYWDSLEVWRKWWSILHASERAEAEATIRKHHRLSDWINKLFSPFWKVENPVSRRRQIDFAEASSSACRWQPSCLYPHRAEGGSCNISSSSCKDTNPFWGLDLIPHLNLIVLEALPPYNITLRIKVFIIQI